MPCNLAVTITKAAVLPEHLAALLTPQIIERIVLAYLKQHPRYKTYQPIRAYQQSDGSVDIWLGSFSYRIKITGTQVSVNFPTNIQTQATQLAEEITTLLAKASDRLFAAQVKQGLEKRFGKVRTTQATVKETQESANPTQVTVFTLEL